MKLAARIAGKAFLIGGVYLSLRFVFGVV